MQEIVIGIGIIAVLLLSVMGFLHWKHHTYVVKRKAEAEAKLKEQLNARAMSRSRSAWRAKRQSKHRR